MIHEEALDHTPLTFGKHRGRTPDQVSQQDPSYVVWMYENVEPTPCSRVLYRACKDEIKLDHDYSEDDLGDDERFHGDL